jgi:hypothetical protein
MKKRGRNRRLGERKEDAKEKPKKWKLGKERWNKIKKIKLKENGNYERMKIGSNFSSYDSAVLLIIAWKFVKTIINK